MPSETKRLSLPFALCGLVLLLGGLVLWHVPACDQAVYRALHLVPGSGAVGPVTALTTLGSFAVLAPVALLAAGWLWYRGRGPAALWLVAAFALVRIALILVKALVHRPRPPIADRLQDVGSWSFPSTHSADSLLVYTLLALAFAGGRAWLVPALLGGIAVGWSRIALGVHWPSDVLAGWGSALLCLGLATRFTPRPATVFG